MKIDITTGMDRTKTKVLIDGVEVKYLRSIKFDVSVETLPVVILELVGNEVTLNGEALVLKEADLSSKSSQELIKASVDAWLEEAGIKQPK